MCNLSYIIICILIDERTKGTHELGTKQPVLSETKILQSWDARWQQWFWWARWWQRGWERSGPREAADTAKTTMDGVYTAAQPSEGKRNTAGAALRAIWTT